MKARLRLDRLCSLRWTHVEPEFSEVVIQCKRDSRTNPGKIKGIKSSLKTCPFSLLSNL